MAKRLRFPEALALLEKEYGRPRTADHPEAPLLDHLLVGVLTAWVDRERAARALRALAESFLDLNEARVSPIAELTSVLHPFCGAKSEEAAVAVRTALQDVYDATHGLDLEPLRGRDPDDLKKFMKELPHTMGGPAACVFQLALGPDRLALMAAEHRVLDRLRLLPRAATPQRVRLALERLVKPAERLAFAWAVGSHAGAVCRRDPRCEQCLMLPSCPYGEQEVKRRELERKKEEARRAAEEKRRRLAEEKAAREKARKDAVEAKKKAVAEAKAAKVAAAKAAAEKAVADRRAKAEAERAERRAKAEAERAERRAKAEAERKAKVEAKKREKAAAAKGKKRR